MKAKKDSVGDSAGKERKGHVAVRLDEATIARIDALVPRLSADWLRVTRSDVLRSLLLRALEEAEKDIDFLQNPPGVGE